ncbi:unnamed protein product [Prorocentrum cordatum]|uniref:Uncharacterized protein n=1 Tax=Prorocentrum cordatum TaxID=2364126 RepID=A0ABN9XW67_9DINO|nr:unnamed protein product [Polarella glacialis]
MLLNNPRREKVHTSERCQGCALRQERLAVAAIRALLLATSACATQLPPHSRQHRPCVAWAAPRSPRAAELAPPRRGEERRGEERRGGGGGGGGGERGCPAGGAEGGRADAAPTLAGRRRLRLPGAARGLEAALKAARPGRSGMSSYRGSWGEK